MIEPVDMTVFYSLEAEVPMAYIMMEIPLKRYRPILTSMGTQEFSQNMIDGIAAALAGSEMDIPFTERLFTIPHKKDETDD